MEGENATLTCKASGRPLPQVYWRTEKNHFLTRGFRDELVQGNFSPTYFFFSLSLSLPLTLIHPLSSLFFIQDNKDNTKKNIPPLFSSFPRKLAGQRIESVTTMKTRLRKQNSLAFLRQRYFSASIPLNGFARSQ